MSRFLKLVSGCQSVYLVHLGVRASHALTCLFGLAMNKIDFDKIELDRIDYDRIEFDRIDF